MTNYSQLIKSDFRNIGRDPMLMMATVAPFLLVAFALFGFPLVSGIFNDFLNLIQLGILAMIIATEAPLMLLFLGAFAGNKVEGIAISKGFGILLMTIVLDYFFRGNWRILLSISPLWWVERVVMNPQYVYPYLFGGAIVHLLFIFLLFRKFINRDG